MHRIAYVFLGTVLSTLFLLQWWQSQTYPLSLWILLSLAFCAAFIRKKYLLCAVPFGIFLALLVVSQTTHISSPHTIDWYANESPMSIRGTIVDEPDRRPLQIRYVVAAESVDVGSGRILPVTGRVLAMDFRMWPRFQIGDRIDIHGTLEKPQGDDEFRYDHYLSRFGIYSVMQRTSISPNPNPNPSHALRFRRSLTAIKEWFEHRMNRIYPEPHASFMAGILTGSRRGIPDHVMEDFTATGLTHIVAISGYNIAIVISMLGSLFFFLPYRFRLVPSILAIFCFVLFVGASASVVRAGIMGILSLLAVQAGRLPHMRLTILWTAALMLALNPKLLWYDAGFQLSFLAVIGISELTALFEPFSSRFPKTLAIRESVQMTVAAQIMTLPVVALLFGRISLVAPLSNLLVAPFIPIAMLLGFLSVVVSFLWFPLGQIVAYFGWAALEWIVLVAYGLSKLPFASVEMSVGPWVIVGYYSIILALLVIKNNTACHGEPVEPSRGVALRRAQGDTANFTKRTSTDFSLPGAMAPPRDQPASSPQT